MKTITILLSATLSLLGAAMSCTSSSSAKIGDTPVTTSTALRIGTFDSRGVALAYGRSSRPDGRVAAGIRIRKEHEKAKAEGNEARVKELETEVAAIQERMHLQVFSGSPIDEILELIKGDMASIAKAANVDLIVGEVLHNSSDVELVDVTYHMCTPFEPDAITRKMIEELIVQPLVPAGDMKHDH